MGYLNNMFDSYRGLEINRGTCKGLMKELHVIQDEMDGIQTEYDKKYAALAEEKAEKMSEVNLRYGEKIVEIRKENNDIEKVLKEVRTVVGVLNGRDLNKVHKISRLQLEKAAFNDVVHFFDEMGDNDMISLRGVIFSDSSFMTRMRGRGRFHLFVFGYSENGLAGD